MDVSHTTERNMLYLPELCNNIILLFFHFGCTVGSYMMIVGTLIAGICYFTVTISCSRIFLTMVTRFYSTRGVSSTNAGKDGSNMVCIQVSKGGIYPYHSRPRDSTKEIISSLSCIPQRRSYGII